MALADAALPPPVVTSYATTRYAHCTFAPQKSVVPCDPAGIA